MRGQYFVYLHSVYFYLQLQQLALHAYQGGLGHTGHNGSTRHGTKLLDWGWHSFDCEGRFLFCFRSTILSLGTTIRHLSWWEQTIKRGKNFCLKIHLPLCLLLKPSDEYCKHWMWNNISGRSNILKRYSRLKYTVHAWQMNLIVKWLPRLQNFIRDYNILLSTITQRRTGSPFGT